ncbi:MAG: stress response translation initiation inhibitor YciH [Pseudomonadales bacterium]|nr:stress response translation initiation inhibitor YciH [Pseudomonadales bacterium]
MAKVYSTEHGRLCPKCSEPQHQGACATAATSAVGDGRVRIQRETKGRKGAGVTLVTGIPLELQALKALHKQLKKRCGVGGAIKQGVLEFQGDQRQVLLAELSKKGWDVKISGG